MNPAARQVALLRAQAAPGATTPPAEPVWAAGTTGGHPAVGALLRVVARLPSGLVVLPGLDRDRETAWAALDDGHPQAGLRDLLAGLGATPRRGRGPGATAAGRAGARCWRTRAAAGRGARARGARAGRRTPDGLFRLDAGRPAGGGGGDRAGAARRAGDARAQRAALVTPDRALAGRVAAELLRWGVVADDSAGEPLGGDAARGVPAPAGRARWPTSWRRCRCWRC